MSNEISDMAKMLADRTVDLFEGKPSCVVKTKLPGGLVCDMVCLLVDSVPEGVVQRGDQSGFMIQGRILPLFIVVDEELYSLAEPMPDTPIYSEGNEWELAALIGRAKL